MLYLQWNYAQSYVVTDFLEHNGTYFWLETHWLPFWQSNPILQNGYYCILMREGRSCSYFPGVREHLLPYQEVRFCCAEVHVDLCRRIRSKTMIHQPPRPQNPPWTQSTLLPFPPCSATSFQLPPTPCLHLSYMPWQDFVVTLAHMGELLPSHQHSGSA